MDSAGQQAHGTEPAGDRLRQVGLRINESLDFDTALLTVMD